MVLPTPTDTKYTKRVIVIVAATKKDDANLQAKKTDTKGGEYAWTIGLSSTGLLPITHYWNNWQMTPAEMTKLKADLTANISPTDIQWFELNDWDPAKAKPTPDEVLLLAKPPLKRIEPKL